MRDDKTVPCGLCGRPTTSVYDQRCDGCWEMETRIEDMPALARKVLERVERGEERPKVYH